MHNIDEVLTLGTGGLAGPPWNLLFWFPSHCHIAIFHLSISDKMSDKEPEQSISDVLSLPSPMSIWVLSIILSFSTVTLSAVSGGWQWTMELYQLCYGHWQGMGRTGTQWSHSFCSERPQAGLCQQRCHVGFPPWLLADPTTRVPCSDVLLAGGRARQQLLHSLLRLCCAPQCLTTLS